jgi:hypothetical protein
MAILATINELTLVGVADRGVPNKERIVLRPTEAVGLSAFALIVVFLRDDQTAIPLRDYFFWFGDLTVAPPGWIYVYSGPGENSVSEIGSTGQTKQPVHVLHWGKEHVLFNDDRVHPALVRLGGIGFGAGGQTHAPATRAEVDAMFRALLNVPVELPSDPPSLTALKNLPARPKK